MNAAFLTFVGLLGLGVGLLASVFLAERKSKQAVSRRLGMVAQEGPQARASKSRRLGVRAESSLVRFFGLGRSGAWWIKTRGYVLLLVGLGSALAVLMIMGMVFKISPWLSALFAAGAFFAIPWCLLVVEQSQAEKRFADRFPDAIDMVVRMLRAGLPVTAALRTVGAEAEPPVSFIFAGLADHVDIGMSLPESLAIAAQEIRLPDFRLRAAEAGIVAEIQCGGWRNRVVACGNAAIGADMAHELGHLETRVIFDGSRRRVRRRLRTARQTSQSAEDGHGGEAGHDPGRRDRRDHGRHARGGLV